MEVYPAIEMMPVYMTFEIIMNMLCGAIILNEAQMYDVKELLLLCLFTAISISGIFVLVNKSDLTCLVSSNKPSEYAT